MNMRWPSRIEFREFWKNKNLMNSDFSTQIILKTWALKDSILRLSFYLCRVKKFAHQGGFTSEIGKKFSTLTGKILPQNYTKKEKKGVFFFFWHNFWRVSHFLYVYISLLDLFIFFFFWPNFLQQAALDFPSATH